MIFVLDATGLVHLMYHIADTKDPPDIVERMLNRMEYLQDWSERTAAKFGQQSRQVAVFDNGRKSFRSLALPSYKAQRTHEPELYECIDHAKESLVNSSGWQLQIAPDTFEADDLIASIAHQSSEAIVIHSADKDFNQCLVDGRVGIVKRSGVDSEWTKQESGGISIRVELEVQTYTERELLQEFGFPARHWIDYQCLVGDVADNVTGARWVGCVTARQIITAAMLRTTESHLSLESLAPSDDLGLNKRQLEHWSDFIKRLPLLRDIFTLRTDLALTSL